MTYTVSIDISDATSGLSVQDDVELVISGDNADDIYPSLEHGTLRSMMVIFKWACIQGRIQCQVRQSL